MAIYNQAWHKICELEGHTERVTSSSDGSITWTVVSQVTDDELKDARERDHRLFQSNDFPILHNTTYEEKKESDFKTGLWKLWPGSIDGDVETINNSIIDENIRQNEKYQRLIKKIIHYFECIIDSSYSIW